MKWKDQPFIKGRVGRCPRAPTHRRGSLRPTLTAWPCDVYFGIHRLMLLGEEIIAGHDQEEVVDVFGICELQLLWVPGFYVLCLCPLILCTSPAFASDAMP